MWQMRVAKRRAQARRAILEDKQRIIVEEEKRKATAKQKLLELEERIAKRHKSTEIKHIETQIKPDSRDQNRRWHYKDICKKKFYSYKHMRAFVQEEHQDKGHDKTPHKKKKSWDLQWSHGHSLYLGSKIPIRNDMTKRTLQKNEIYNPRMPSSQMNTIHGGYQKDEDDKAPSKALIAMEVESEIRCINLSFTCWRAIAPHWKYGMLWIPLSSLHQITKGELVVFPYKLCECRMKMPGSMTTFKGKSQSSWLVKRDLNTVIKGTMVQRRRHEYIGVTHSLVENDHRHEGQGQVLERQYNQARSRYIRRQVTREGGKKISSIDARKKIIIHEDEGLWEHMDTRHKWPNLCFVDLWEHIGMRHKWPNPCFVGEAISQGGME